MRLVCITGMHRSGTSLVAQLVHTLGVDLGPEDQHLAAGEENPAGFWEYRPIKELNQDLLEHLGGDWSAPPVLVPGWERSRDLEPFRERGRRCLREAFHGGEVAGWKDPRTSLTLPFWRTVTDVHRTIIVVRAPDDVAASLRTRNGFSSEHSASLWLRYVCSAWANDPTGLVVDYDDALERPQDISRTLAAHIGVGAPTPSVSRAIGDVAQPDLRRSRGREKGTAGTGMRAARYLYDVIRSDPEELAPVLQLIAAMADAGQYAGVAETNRRLRSELDQVRADLSELEREHSAVMGKRTVQAALRISAGLESFRHADQ